MDSGSGSNGSDGGFVSWAPTAPCKKTKVAFLVTHFRRSHLRENPVLSETIKTVVHPAARKDAHN